MHPFRPKAICINWLRYRPGTYPGVLIDIPLRAINEERCPAIKEGGWLLELTSKVRARSRCVGAHMHRTLWVITLCVASINPSCGAHDLQLSVYASGESIPDRLIMDLRGLRAGARIMASHVELNEGLTLVRRQGAHGGGADDERTIESAYVRNA